MFESGAHKVKPPETGPLLPAPDTKKAKLRIAGGKAALQPSIRGVRRGLEVDVMRRDTVQKEWEAEMRRATRGRERPRLKSY